MSEETKPTFQELVETEKRDMRKRFFDPHPDAKRVPVQDTPMYKDLVAEEQRHRDALVPTRQPSLQEQANEWAERIAVLELEMRIVVRRAADSEERVRALEQRVMDLQRWQMSMVGKEEHKAGLTD